MKWTMMHYFYNLSKKKSYPSLEVFGWETGSHSLALICIFVLYFLKCILTLRILLLFLFIKQDTTKEYIVYEYHKVFLDIHLLGHIHLWIWWDFPTYSFITWYLCGVPFSYYSNRILAKVFLPCVVDVHTLPCILQMILWITLVSIALFCMCELMSN